MTKFEIAYKPLKAFEGGYVNDPADRGGETYKGIARNFWKEWAGWSIIDSLKTDPSFKAGARAFTSFLSQNDELERLVNSFYKEEWWDKLLLENLPQSLGSEIFEQAINCGISSTVKKVQTACNALNFKKNTSLFTDLVVDGVMGNKTIDALMLVQKEFGEHTLFHILNALQIHHYINIASNKASQRKFIRGWLTRTNIQN